MSQDAGQGKSSVYAEIVREALTKVIGKEGPSTILFFTGEPRPEDFERKLRGILGAGADVILHEMAEGLEKLKASDSLWVTVKSADSRL
jgi:hypothetical protein